MLIPLAALSIFPFTALAARQPYDVRKIIQAFREPHEDLTILCAHRGLRWNGTSENSRDAYFRASEAGLECIETDIHLSADGYLPMIHDKGLGRTTDIGEQTGQAAYNPYTGKGFNPEVSTMNFTGPNGIERLRLRDDQGRVRDEYVPSLPQIIESIRDSGMNVVLELDFKDQAAIEPAYWAMKNLANSAGVPANEWCIYKLQSVWYKSPEEFESLPWVQDAFHSGIQLAFIPVYDPAYEDDFDQLASMRKFAATNYTISAEIELRSVDGPIQDLLDETKGNGSSIRTAGTL
jgi:glycerophosphoryl diester phosphodiesterase